MQCVHLYVVLPSCRRAGGAFNKLAPAENIHTTFNLVPLMGTLRGYSSFNIRTHCGTTTVSKIQIHLEALAVMPWRMGIIMMIGEWLT